MKTIAAETFLRNNYIKRSSENYSSFILSIHINTENHELCPDLCPKMDKVSIFGHS